jgi:hypothetical protein
VGLEAVIDMVTKQIQKSLANRGFKVSVCCTLYVKSGIWFYLSTILTNIQTEIISDFFTTRCTIVWGQAVMESEISVIVFMLPLRHVFLFQFLFLYSETLLIRTKRGKG